MNQNAMQPQLTFLQIYFQTTTEQSTSFLPNSSQLEKLSRQNINKTKQNLKLTPNQPSWKPAENTQKFK